MSGNASHIVIAGGGMVGLSLAVLLAESLPEAITVTLIEGMALPSRSGRGGDETPWHPSFDARSTALSFSSAEVFRRVGLWERLLPGLAPIESIHVSRRGRFGSSILQAREQGWEALGWVTENAWLGRTLLAAVRDTTEVRLRCPARVVDARPDGAGVAVVIREEEADEEMLRADLLVIADGAESQLREQLGFFTRRSAYGQDALIANIAFAKSLRGCAFERFTASGPLALLPLPASAAGEHRGALVWTLPPDEAAQLVDADEETFSAALIEAFGYRLGRPLRIGRRQSYPLALTEAMEQVRRAMVVVGNAAHALHPVAGQGFNLALRDVAALADTLAAATTAGASPGDLTALEQYLQARRRDQTQTVLASDGLPQLFALSDPVLGLTRDLALAGMDVLPAARRLFVQQAAGMAALEAASG